MMDQNLASAPTPNLGPWNSGTKKESRGFVPGKGHPSIVKKWEYMGSGPVTRPNPFKKKEVKHAQV